MGLEEGWLADSNCDDDDDAGADDEGSRPDRLRVYRLTSLKDHQLMGPQALGLRAYKPMGSKLTNCKAQ
eukprot:7311538-Karenia_brevis.AAC.1